jgi:elongation factor Ts
MAAFSAKDVQALRQSSGAGMMDAKKALVEADGDMEKAAAILREKGLAKSATRTDRENSQGTVAIATSDTAVAAAVLKSETDFVATSGDFVALVQTLADAALTDPDSAAEGVKDKVDEMKITLKENIEVGELVRFEAAEGNVVDAYLHKQSGRGVLGVLVELNGGTAELAHDLAVHIAFAKPTYIVRDEVPEAEVAAERTTLEGEAKASGKPEQAWPKIVEGKLTAWFSETVLLDQKFAKDDKQTVAKILGDASVVRFSLVSIGG